MISQTIWCLHKLNLCIHVSASQSINTFLNKQRHFKEHSTNFTVKKHLKWNISCDTPYDYYSIKLEKWNMLIRKLSAWYDNVPASDEVSMSPNVPPPLHAISTEFNKIFVHSHLTTNSTDRADQKICDENL